MDINNLNLNLSDIFSDDELKALLSGILEEFELQREEAMDMYMIFKDMVINSGDFDSSVATKEQLTNLLKNAQDASSSKMKIFELLLKSRTKENLLDRPEIHNQNNVFISDRRELNKLIEEMSSKKEIEFQESAQELEILENNTEEEINTKNNDFEIKSGEIE